MEDNEEQPLFNGEESVTWEANVSWGLERNPSQNLPGRVPAKVADSQWLQELIVAIAFCMRPATVLLYMNRQRLTLLVMFLCTCTAMMLLFNY